MRCTAPNYLACMYGPALQHGMQIMKGRRRSIDTVGATFINMVMDRLQTLETDSMKQLAALRQDNKVLKQQVQQLSRSLHMHSDLHTFSDGYMLLPGFGTDEDRMILVNVGGDPDEEPLDESHLNAVAIWGRVGLDICLEEPLHDMQAASADLLVIGQDGQPTTVRQLLLALTACCTSHREAGRWTVVDALDMYMGFERSGHDFGHDVTVYSMICV